MTSEDQSTTGHREIVDYYSSRFDEDSRLRGGPERLEFVRTVDILERLLPEPPAAVVDVGGASGIYSTWLLEHGYEAHLVDPVPLHVEQAAEAFASIAEGPARSATVGHGGALPQGDSFADAVLLMGPLYHLWERAERLSALGEAARVLKPGALLFAVGISRFASLIDGLAGGHLEDPVFADIVDGDLRDGRHKNLGDNPLWWTNAYFHRPEELEAEVREAGFEFEHLVGVEMVGWAAWNKLPEILGESSPMPRFLEFLRRVEREPSLIGASPHFAAVARKPA